MNSINSIAIFDIGKTNKKFFLLNEGYKIVLERTVQFEEMTDEDGDACEDIAALSEWVLEMIREVLRLKKFSVSAINFSTYGASFVYVDEDGKVIGPLYNYLKSFPIELKKNFYQKYGGEEKLSLETSSPVLGNLNSGMQLYRIKKNRPDIFTQLKYALHLPQFISFLITGQYFSDITSVGCHTQLWDFSRNAYHHWVTAEELDKKLPPVFSSADVVNISFEGHLFKAGIGLHDSSAALIPYLHNFTEPFILISTGTWCISFNPFNHQPLTIDELNNDCLCYMEYNGNPVKASRLFAGYEHEQQTKRLAAHFSKKENYYSQVVYDPAFIMEDIKGCIAKPMSNNSGFDKDSLDGFTTFEEAYHCLMQHIILQQFISTGLVADDKIKRIFVDGGFSKNSIYMNLLSLMFPDKEIFAATVSQATAVGAALAIHTHWNNKAVAADMIELKLYATTQKIVSG